MHLSTGLDLGVFTYTEHLVSLLFFDSCLILTFLLCSLVALIFQVLIHARHDYTFHCPVGTAAWKTDYTRPQLFALDKNLLYPIQHTHIYTHKFFLFLCLPYFSTHFVNWMLGDASSSSQLPMFSLLSNYLSTLLSLFFIPLVVIYLSPLFWAFLKRETVLQLPRSLSIKGAPSSR
jgi:hypothetical protein